MFFILNNLESHIFVHNPILKIKQPRYSCDLYVEANSV